MSRNYHIDRRELKASIQTVRERLDHVHRLLPELDSPNREHSGRNLLTSALDTAFAFVRKYLPPVHWFFAAITAAVLFLYAESVAMTSRLETRGAVGWPHVPAPSVLALWHRDAPSLLVAFAKRPPHVRTVIMIARDPRGDY